MRPRPEEAGGSEVLRGRSDADRRRAARERAERLDSLRGRFGRHMRNQGMSEEQREQEFRQMDEVIERLRREAER